MADRAQQMTRFWPGILTAAIVLALTLGTLAAVAFRADSWGGFTPADWAAVRFTLWQAFLSALISVVLAIPVARALARRRFWGRSVLVTLLGAPFILPAIVAVLGLLAVFGRNGIISVGLGWLGLPPVQIYGLHGVVLAHVFFNLPLATRLILQAWQAVPGEHFRLTATLGFSAADVGRAIERPLLRATLPGAFMVIFVICTTSFAVALTLGGGPRATTVELAIYQAFRFDFDLGKAALLALVQFAICAVAALGLRLQIPQITSAGLDRVQRRWDADRAGLRAIDVAWISLVAVFLWTPLLMVIVSGLAGIGNLPMSVFAAAFRSICVAMTSAVLSVSMALALALTIQNIASRLGAGLLEATGYLAIAASPLVIGTGLFLIVFPFVDPVALALPITALVNAVMSLPFALRALTPQVQQVAEVYGRLADNLGLTGWARLRHLYIPRLRRPLGFSAGLAAALSMGDLGVIALFGDPDSATLPLQLYRLMAAYRMEDAAGAALLLLALSMGFFWAFDRGGRMDADT
ncbi:MAG: thiamine/thiamine pyrophosphate ABC transporter permease ThiP [Marinosulfonomonas sp.]|nr:thiamine/thiamine pyrophosphate ABC transporter permease ThiP [Marinosulfonomonas sp.]